MKPILSKHTNPFAPRIKKKVIIRMKSMMHMIIYLYLGMNTTIWLDVQEEVHSK